MVLLLLDGRTFIGLARRLTNLLPERDEEDHRNGRTNKTLYDSGPIDELTGHDPVQVQQRKAEFPEKDDHRKHARYFEYRHESFRAHDSQSHLASSENKANRSRDLHALSTAARIRKCWNGRVSSCCDLVATKMPSELKPGGPQAGPLAADDLEEHCSARDLRRNRRTENHNEQAHDWWSHDPPSSLTKQHRPED